METLETADCRYWLDDCMIVHIAFAPGTVIDLEVARRSVEIGTDNFPQQPRLLLMSLEGIKSIDRAARTYLADCSGPTAVALLGLSPVARVISAVFQGLRRRTTYPVRAFSSEDVAVAWLKRFARPPTADPREQGNGS